MISTLDDIYKRLNDDLDSCEVYSSVSNIQRFYAGKSIFLTGATGFIGKCLVEKILRSIPDIEKLYILVRCNNDLSPQEKTKKYFQHIVFNNLRNENPNFQDKVVTIAGDLECDRLGISDEDRRLLITKTDIMIHNGATTRFNEVVRTILRVNVLATKSMLELACDCERLKIFIFVSTAYSHCYRKFIDEEFYEGAADLKLINDMITADSTTKNGLSKESIKMLSGQWPNIYTFSKAAAEELISQQAPRANFICVIYRPSIITAAYKEPLEGWSVRSSGPGNIFYGTGMGIIHVMYDKDEPMDLIPVDYSVNALIGITESVCRQGLTLKQAQVFNFTSSCANPLTLPYLYKCSVITISLLATIQSLWVPSLILTSHKLTFYFLHFLLHFIPACFADLAFLIMKKRPRAVKVFFLSMEFMDLIEYFVAFGWRISAHKTLKVYDEMNSMDQQLFPFDIRTLDWFDFTYNYVKGTRVYVLKEPLDNLPEAKKRFRKLLFMHYVLKGLFYFFLYYCLLRLFLWLQNYLLYA